MWKGEGQTWGQKIGSSSFGVSFYPGILNLEHVAELPFLTAPTLEVFFICCASVSHVFQIRLSFNGFHLMSGPSQDFTIQGWEGMGSFVVTILLGIASAAT